MHHNKGLRVCRAQGVSPTAHDLGFDGLCVLWRLLLQLKAKRMRQLRSVDLHTL